MHIFCQNCGSDLMSFLKNNLRSNICVLHSFLFYAEAIVQSTYEETQTKHHPHVARPGRQAKLLAIDHTLT